MSGRSRPVRIGIVGDFDPRVTAHRAIPKALELAGRDIGLRVEPHWLATENLAHPFFIATLFQPERCALRDEINPIIRGYVAIAAGMATHPVRPETKGELS